MKEQPHLPFDGSYAATVVLVLLALTPNIVVTTAVSLFEGPLGTQLHASRATLALSPALSNAGYAFGAVLAADLFARFNPRRLFIFCECGFIVGAILSAVAPDAPWFIVGRLLQGVSTGWMLVVAVPPLVNRFPPEKMPSTALTFLVGFFGAAMAGPLIGGLVAHANAPRTFFAVLALLGSLNVAMILLTVPSAAPKQPELPFDGAAVGLAGAGTFLSFVGVWLLGAGTLRALPWLLVAAGLASLVALLVIEYRAKEPLVPVKPLSTSLPVLGVICAMLSGAVFVAVLEMIELTLLRVRHLEPLAVGLLFWPQVLGVALAGIAFWLLFRTRYIALLALTGMVALLIAAILTARGAFEVPAALGAIAGLLGLGAGLTVSPGLILAAFGVPSKQIGRTFALVELLRSFAAYLIGPVFLAFAQAAMPAMIDSVRTSAWLCAALMTATIVALIFTFARSGLRLQAPDLEAWIVAGEQAMESPPVRAA